MFGVPRRFRSLKNVAVEPHNKKIGTLVQFFIDLETKERIHLNPEELKAEYQKQREEFKKEIYSKCHQNRIDLIEADINEGVDEILRAYLIKRKRMV